MQLLTKALYVVIVMLLVLVAPASATITISKENNIVTAKYDDTVIYLGDNDNTAIQYAIDYNGGQNHIIIKRGVYNNINIELTMASYLEGEGASTILYSQQNKPIITIEGGNNNIIIKNLQLKSNIEADGILINGSNNNRVSYIYINNIYSVDLNNHIRVLYSDSGRYDRNIMLGGNVGYKLDFSIDDFYTDNSMAGMRDGIIIDYSEGSHFLKTRISNVTRYGYWHKNGYYNSLESSVIACGNQNAVMITGGRSIYISKNYLNNNQINRNVINIDSTDAGIRDIIFSENVVEGGEYWGMSILSKNDINNINIKDNLFVDNGDQNIGGQGDILFYERDGTSMRDINVAGNVFKTHMNAAYNIYELGSPSNINYFNNINNNNKPSNILNLRDI